MNPFDRRRFLAGGIAVGAAAALPGTAYAQSLGSLGGAASPTSPPTTTPPAPTSGMPPTQLGTDGGILVMVTLYGGNDGLNTVIPFDDPVYQAKRPGLAYSAAEALHLDEHLGFNPSMTGLHRMWGEGNVAVVRGAGYPRPDRSHFRSMDIWQSGSPLTPLNSGWLGRWLDRSGAGPLGAVHLGSTLPMVVTGERRTAAVIPVSGAENASAATRTAAVAMAAEDPADAPLATFVRDSQRLEISAAETFDVLTAGQVADDKTSETGGASAGGQGGLEFQLRVVARAIRAGVPTRVYSVSLGGFDHHSEERAEQSRLMGVVDRAVTGLFAQLKGHPDAHRVVVAVHSEFGRRVEANASQGTDHGAAAPVILAGAPVKGGFHGDEPSLTDLDDGDLKYTVDFRDVFHELSGRVLRMDPDSILDPGRKDVGVLV